MGLRWWHVPAIIAISACGVAAWIIWGSVYCRPCHTSLTRAQLHAVGGKLESYRLDHRRWPAVLDDLLADGTRPAYARARDLVDPWKVPFYYRVEESTSTVVLFSLGRDGVPGGQEADSDAHLVLTPE
jgi:general secretion pathway protein G